MDNLVIIAISVIAFFAVSYKADQELIGNMKPIGYQKATIKDGIPEFKFIPSGKYFYENFMYPGKPAIFRGVFNNTKSMEKWTNVTYMREKYGDTRGVVDRRKQWKNGGRELIPRSVMDYSEFLDNYEHKQLYWDYEIPRNHSILRDIPLPISLNCKFMVNTILYYNLLVNSGGVSYVLHKDFADNFYYLFSGSKRWFLTDRKYIKDCYIGQGTEISSLSPVSPDSVDLEKYPNIAKVPFHEFDVNAGDILYVPRNWPHYVVSKSGKTTMALNIWLGGDHIGQEYPPTIPCDIQRMKLSKLLNG